MSEKLNTSILASVYDLEYTFDEDTRFIKNIAGKSEKIFELGCGTGRVLCDLIADGYSADGCDISGEAIEMLKSKLDPAKYQPELLVADMAKFQTAKKYDFIFSVFNSFMMLTTSELMVECLQNASRHMNPGGKILLSTANPSIERMAEKFAYVKHQKTLKNKVTGCDIDKFEYNHFDLDKQLIHRTFYYDEIVDGVLRREENKFTVRYIFKYEFILMMKLAGFEVLEMYGNWDKSRLTPDSPSIIMLARKVK